MRFLIVGAGAVGALVGAQLARSGHDVHFWVRPQQRCERARLKIESVVTHDGFEIFAPFLAAGDTVPEHDWVFVCVRGEQLDETLQQIAAQLGTAQNLVISTVSVDDVRERARRHGLQGNVLAHHVSFGVHRDPADDEHFLWFPFAAPSIVSAEGERARLPAARALASALNKAGLRSIAMRSARNSMTLMMGLSAPFLAAWDVCDFELERLARDRELRKLTARAMVEAPRSLHFTGLGRLARLLPAWFWSLVLRLLPHLIGAHGREVWVHHGPKVREQTRYCLGLVQQTSRPMPALHALAGRFERRFSRAAA
jgi:2-dehydropantoate 2-reductase